MAPASKPVTCGDHRLGSRCHKRKDRPLDTCESVRNVQADEMLGAVVERLLKALREARPATVRQFFALAGQHTRWELNDLARRLDTQPRAVEALDGLLPAAAASDSGLTPDGRRMIEVIEGLPADEREVFDLVRIQGMSQAEAAELLGVAPKTVKRRLDRGLRLLTERLADLCPDEPALVAT